MKFESLLLEALTRFDFLWENKARKLSFDWYMQLHILGKKKESAKKAGGEF